MRMAMAVAVALGMSCAATPGASAKGHSGDEPGFTARSDSAAPARPGSRYAARGPAKQPGLIDADEDGTVSMREARRYYGWLFSVLDRDGDGTVAEAEFMAALGPARSSVDPTRSAARAARVSTLFQRLDDDADRVLAVSEFMRACEAHFASSDADGNGRVSAGEFGAKRAL